MKKMTSEQSMCEGATRLDKELEIIEYILGREKSAKFESVELILFFQTTSKTKEDVLTVLKNAKEELTKRSNNKKSIADIYSKISKLEETKTCPNCGQTMYKKGIDIFRQVYDCSNCSCKEFYMDGELITNPQIEGESQDSSQTSKRCPECGNADLGEMIFSTKNDLKNPDIGIECRKCGKKFSIPWESQNKGGVPS